MTCIFEWFEYSHQGTQKEMKEKRLLRMVRRPESWEFLCVHSHTQRIVRASLAYTNNLIWLMAL